MDHNLNLEGAWSRAKGEIHLRGTEGIVSGNFKTGGLKMRFPTI